MAALLGLFVILFLIDSWAIRVWHQPLIPATRQQFNQALIVAFAILVVFVGAVFAVEWLADTEIFVWAVGFVIIGASVQGLIVSLLLHKGLTTR